MAALDTFLFTSESVNEGHPDKLCDQVRSLCVCARAGALGPWAGTWNLDPGRLAAAEGAPRGREEAKPPFEFPPSPTTAHPSASAGSAAAACNPAARDEARAARLVRAAA
jgi:hypothetical protein